MPTDDTDRRCLAGRDCADSVPLDDGDVGHRYVGALLERPADRLCEGCRMGLRDALDDLPRLVSSLAGAIAKMPSYETRYRTMDITGGGNVEPDIPMDVHRDALVRLIVHETESWAEILTNDHGLAWDPDAARRRTWYGRTFDACRVLGVVLDDWITCGPRTYPARSLAVRRAHGHDPDVAIRTLDDIYGRRDGATAALLVLNLYERAERADPIGGPVVDILPAPCAKCGTPRAVVRRHDWGDVQCRACRHTQSDGARDAYLEAALAEHAARPVADPPPPVGEVA